MRRLILTLAAGIVALMPSRAADLTTLQAASIYKENFEGATPTRVSVHDPSVVIGYEGTDGKVYGENATGRKKVYCIFGSHRAWAKSYDLQNWTTFTNNISTNYATIFKTDAAYSAHGSSSYDVSGNLWAPDVIWNKAMGKWCMYMSVNGDSFYSSIVLLTAESLTGNWTRVGSVVYSLGKTSDNGKYASETDVYKVLGENADLSRYFWYRNSVNNHTYGTNAIDPCVFYDESGDLWMSYGSWFGGLYLLKLDKSTGLRDYTYTYETKYEQADGAYQGKMDINWCTSDAYQGIKIAGGNHCSGEASYIEYHDGYYWLFVTYGGLTATGGYNMRVFKSTSVTGPYTDISGDDARYSKTGTNGSTNAGQIKRSVGTRLMSYYRWGFMDYGYCAQGHNSAVVDTDGKMFLVYHTRFDDGTEGHQVRVHQMFTTSDGLVMAAPFEYRGETLSTSAYSTSDIAGYYGIIRHGNGTDHTKLECAQEEVIQLKADGTVTGAYNGTWSASASSPAITISIRVSGSTETYTGYLLTQKLEETNYETLCFTSVDSYDKSLWGYKRGSEASTFDNEAAVAYAYHNLTSSVATSVFAGSKLTLPSTIKGVTATYKSANTAAISDEGLVSATTTATSATLNVTLTMGDAALTTPLTVSIMKPISGLLPMNADAILGHYADGTTLATEPQVSISDETGLSLSFMVRGITSDWTPIAKSSDDKFILYLSVLHYDDTNYFEAAATATSDATKAMSSEGKGAWQLFLNGSYYVTVSYNVDGTISYYRDGVKMLTYKDSSTAAAGSTKPSDIVATVIDHYLAGELSFSADVENVVVGYAADYNPAKLVETLPVDEKNVLSSYFSDIMYAADAPSSKISTSTGLSFSFLVSGLESDWDLIAQSADENYKLYLSVLHYGATDYYEHLGVVSADATAAIAAESLAGPYQLFLGGTHYATVSYNVDGTISYYRDGVLMLTFNDDCTPANGTAKPSEIVKSVIEAYSAGNISFSRSVTSLVVGYAMDYVPSSEATSNIVAEAAEISIRTQGGAIVVSGDADVRVFDVAGRLCFAGRSGRIEGLGRGLYVVKAGMASAVVRI